MKRLAWPLLAPGLFLFPSLITAAETAEDLRKKAQAVLAQIEGQIALPGLKEPVEVLRDRWGVPHIYAKSADDLFFAQGFVAAQDRLWQIDWWRRVGNGETAEVLGKVGLEGDRFARLMKYRGDMEAEWASYSPDTRAIATAFTRGINACIDQMGDKLPIEFQILGYKPKKWQPEDILGRMSGIIMTRNFRDEVLRAQLIATVGLEKARQLAPTDPAVDFGPVAGLDFLGIEKKLLAGYEAATRPLKFSTDGDGSNNWAVDGTLSASGKPMLASDPHRAITLPSLRYLVHLNAPGWNVVGAGEPGLPGVALGHNERIAWGITIVGTDQADWYVEETDPANPHRYKAGDNWETMHHVTEPIAIKGESSARVELTFTRHGPVLAMDKGRNRAYVLKWIGTEPGAAAYLGGIALGRAKNWQEFQKALPHWKVPALNFMYADVDGHIGWVAGGGVPVRPGWDGLLPVPGPRGHEWQRFLTVPELPQAFDPPQHYLATANHNILPPKYSNMIAYEWAPRYRIDRIRQRLQGPKKLDLTDMQSIQHDFTSLPGQELAKLARRLKVARALQPHAELLASWDGVLTVDTPAGPLFAAWQDELLRAFYGQTAPATVQDLLRANRGLAVMLAELEKPTAAWFGERPEPARDTLLNQTFARAVGRIEGLLGDDSRKWTWGQLHVTKFEHPLTSLGKPYAEAFNLAPVPYGGDGNTPNNGRFNDKFEKIHGASYRQVFDLADWDRGQATSVPGQSAQPGSPHYSDLLPLWEKGKYFPLAYSRAKVEEVTRHRLRLMPAQ